MATDEQVKALVNRIAELESEVSLLRGRVTKTPVCQYCGKVDSLCNGVYYSLEYGSDLCNPCWYKRNKERHKADIYERPIGAKPLPEGWDG